MMIDLYTYILLIYFFVVISLFCSISYLSIVTIIKELEESLKSKCLTRIYKKQVILHEL